MKALTLGLAVASLFVVSCGQEGRPPAPPTKNVLKYAEHAFRDKDAKKRYLLIAGGADSANFGQEVVEQKKWLLGLGVPAAEITCFYAIPEEEAFHKDEEQYRALAGDLEACYPASPKFVYDQLQDGAVEEESRYVYITSHGNQPMSVKAKRSDTKGDEKKNLRDWLGLFPKLDQFVVSLDALQDGSPSDQNDRLMLLAKGESPLEHLFFTPAICEICCG